VTSRLPPALVLAAGLGTRLRPLTFSRAKAAVPVAGTPLICRQLRGLAEAGVRDVVVNLHHRPETVAAVVGDGAALGCRVRYSWERTVLGSAGGPRRALPLLDDRFFIVNADTLCAVDFGALLDRHRAAGAVATLAVTAHPAPHRYGGVLADPGGRVAGFAPAGAATGAGAPWHFVGVQIVEAAVFRDLPDGAPAATVGGLYDTLLAAGRPMAVHEVAGPFHDIGTPADYAATVRSVAAAEGRSPFSAGDRSEIHPTARVERSILWDDVAVGADCVVTGCVLADGVRVPAGTVLDGQAVARAGAGRDGGSAPPAHETRLGDLRMAPL
jgi:NDP-sugar pyrophosphorylase family protein